MIYRLFYEFINQNHDCVNRTTEMPGISPLIDYETLKLKQL